MRMILAFKYSQVNFTNDTIFEYINWTLFLEHCAFENCLFLIHILVSFETGRENNDEKRGTARAIIWFHNGDERKVYSAVAKIGHQ